MLETTLFIAWRNSVKLNICPHSTVGTSIHVLTFMACRYHKWTCLTIQYWTLRKVIYLRIWSSNCTVLWVSFSLGTVNRRPAHNYKKKKHRKCIQLIQEDEKWIIWKWEGCLAFDLVLLFVQEPLPLINIFKSNEKLTCSFCCQVPERNIFLTVNR